MADRYPGYPGGAGMGGCVVLATVQMTEPVFAAVPVSVFGTAKVIVALLVAAVLPP